jgi:hypothetical protein
MCLVAGKMERKNDYIWDYVSIKSVLGLTSDELNME